MNQDQVLGILRVIAPAILSYAVGKGWITSSQVGDLTAAAVTIGGVVWSFLAHSNTGKVASVASMSATDVNAATAALPAQAKLAIAAALPEVRQIVTTTQATATAAPSVKVVGPTGDPGPVAP